MVTISVKRLVVGAVVTAGVAVVSLSGGTASTAQAQGIPTSTGSWNQANQAALFQTSAADMQRAQIMLAQSRTGTQPSSRWQIMQSTQTRIAEITLSVSPYRTPARITAPTGLNGYIR
jgi:hypothetical protein